MKIQSVDRFIPTRAFIDFDVAYYKMTHENDENDVKENMYLKGSINVSEKKINCGGSKWLKKKVVCFRGGLN